MMILLQAGIETHPQFIPHGSETVRCLAASCKHGYRRLVDTHTFDFAGIGYITLQHGLHECGRVLHDQAMHLPAHIDHGEIRLQFFPVDLVALEELDYLLIGPQ